MRLPADTKYLAFADDVAIIAQETDTWCLKGLLEAAVEKTYEWLRDAGLQLALQKYEVLVITKQRHHNQLEIEISGDQWRVLRDIKTK